MDWSTYENEATEFTRTYSLQKKQEKEQRMKRIYQEIREKSPVWIGLREEATLHPEFMGRMEESAKQP